jgi:riboflavin synthase
MFTGIVEELGEVESIESTDEGARLRVRAGLSSELKAGDSVSVGGACLTATVADGDAFEADVMNQTLALTTLGELRSGDRVNLELPLRASDRLGGHVVQGHVDAVGRVRSVDPEGEGRRVWIDAPPDLLRLCVEKGSIAVQGVSLTIAELDDAGFAVALIPHTLVETTLGELDPGDDVNLEADVLAKYVERLVAR